MKTAKQWYDEMKSRPCVTETDLLVVIRQIQEDAFHETKMELEELRQAIGILQNATKRRDS